MPMTPTHHQGAASPVGALGGPARHQSLEGGLGRRGLPQRGTARHQSLRLLMPQHHKRRIFTFYCKATKNYLHSHIASQSLSSKPLLPILSQASTGTEPKVLGSCPRPARQPLQVPMLRQ